MKRLLKFEVFSPIFVVAEKPEFCGTEFHCRVGLSNAMAELRQNLKSILEKIALKKLTTR